MHVCTSMAVAALAEFIVRCCCKYGCVMFVGRPTIGDIVCPPNKAFAQRVLSISYVT